MYFQTGQVIFVPEWPKGEFVSILASFCVWTKSFICKDAGNRDSTVQSEVRRISKFPVSRPDDVSSRPDPHLSTATSVQTMCHPVRTSDSPASAVQTMCHPVRTPICLLLHPSRRCVIPSERQTVQHHPSGRCGISSGPVSP